MTAHQIEKTKTQNRVCKSATSPSELLPNVFLKVRCRRSGTRAETSIAQSERRQSQGEVGVCLLQMIAQRTGLDLYRSGSSYPGRTGYWPATSGRSAAQSGITKVAHFAKIIDNLRLRPQPNQKV